MANCYRTFAKTDLIELETKIYDNPTIDVDACDQNGATLMHTACDNGDSQAVRSLIKHRASVNIADQTGFTPLMMAAKGDHVDAIKELLPHNPDLEFADVGGWTALIWAAYKGSVNAVQLLISRGANPNATDEHGMSALSWAAGRGHLNTVQTLVLAEARVGAIDKYGSTPLIWASRKGHDAVVRFLLSHGADVHVVGMNRWTALLAACKFNFTECADILLSAESDPNVYDKSESSSLLYAAKHGNYHLATSLLEAGAMINVSDKDKDTALIHAVKSGHPELVKLFLNKCCNVDAQGDDGKTALYRAVDRGLVHIALDIIKHGASTEIATHTDRITPLIQAVKKRHPDCVSVLLSHGAKVTASDINGNTALHFAVMAQSRRLTSLLLSNPRDARLLYKPNRQGETPYYLDSQNGKSVLIHIFGAKRINETDADDSLLGYDLYSNALADLLSEPSLCTPIVVGLYAKWGSGKSFLIRKLQEAMKCFASDTSLTPHLRLSSPFLFGIVISISFLLGYSVLLPTTWQLGLSASAVAIAAQYFFLAFVWYGYYQRDWDWCFWTNFYLTKRLAHIKLLLQIFFCVPPVTDNDVAVSTTKLRYLFTDYTRLSSVGGEKSLAELVANLSHAAEKEFGAIVTRLSSIVKPRKGGSGGSLRLRTICCMPYFIMVLISVACFLLGFGLLIKLGIQPYMSAETQRNSTSQGQPFNFWNPSVYVAIVCFVFLGVVILLNFRLLFRALRLLSMSPRRRLRNASNRILKLTSEGFMQVLRNEVRALTSLVVSIDGFTGYRTRLVVIVDGLDSCEQQKILQMLDTVEILFNSTNTPFVTILALDPNIVVHGLDRNLGNTNPLFRDANITGHDYLRNVVHLPFYVQARSKLLQWMGDTVLNNQQLVETGTFVDPAGSIVLHEKNRPRTGTYVSHRRSTVHRVDSTKQSLISLNDTSSQKHSYVGSNRHFDFGNRPGGSVLFDIGQQLGTSDYFSEMNPRSMRRVLNIVALMGRLLRAYHLEFSWFRLAMWVNLTEQWPFRLCWVIVHYEENLKEMNDDRSLQSLYESVKITIPSDRELPTAFQVDRDPRKLFAVLGSQSPRLRIKDMRNFLPATINIDPYLLKAVKDLKRDMLEPGFIDRMSRDPSVEPFGGQQQQLLSTIPVHSHSYLAAATGAVQQTLPNPSATLGLRPSAQTLQLPIPVPQRTVAPSASFNLSQAAKIDYPIEGIDTNERLSTMSVEDVCSLLQRLKGLSPANVQRYSATVTQENISGFVLSSCDLDELKPVLRMAFGDWQFFHRTVLYLRYTEENNRLSNVSPSHEPASCNSGLQMCQSTAETPMTTTPSLPHHTSGQLDCGNSTNKSYQHTPVYSSPPLSPLNVGSPLGSIPDLDSVDSKRKVVVSPRGGAFKRKTSIADNAALESQILQKAISVIFQGNDNGAESSASGSDTASIDKLENQSNFTLSSNEDSQEKD